jgi:DNA-binding NtrC family response regulator
VRELRNLIERTLILGKFPSDLDNGSPPERMVETGTTLEEVERRHILAVLQETNGNREEAARRLGISRKTIDRKCMAWNV